MRVSFFATSRGASTRAALRVARRDALRHKGRSALVIAMVALPVLGLSAADVLARTMQLSPAQRIDREIGTADVGASLQGGHVLQDRADGLSGGSSSDGSTPRPGSVAFAAHLGELRRMFPGDRMIRTSEAGTVAGAGDRLADADAISLDVADPIAAGMTRHDAGRAPRTSSEVALSPHLADRLGVHLGDQVTVAGRLHTLVGTYSDPRDINGSAVFQLPETAPQPADAPTTWLFRTGLPVSWAQVQQLNRDGFAVTSRTVVEHPPPHLGAGSSSGHAELIGIATVAVGLAVLEVVLLAGAAFAVGARRQRHDLALVAATGGDASQVASIVLAGGLVLGTVGAVVGVAGGVLTAWLALPLMEHFADAAAGPFDLRPLELFAVALLGIATGVAAAVLPARAAARDDVVAALSGRRAAASTRGRVPALGITMIVVGAFIAAYAAHPPARFSLILAGAVISELGFVVCSPGLVGLAGRLARFAPLAPRLALRDAARHRGRTGPAVAAIMAAVAGSIAVSTYIVSQVAHDRAQYEPSARIGQPLLRLDGGGTSATQLRAQQISFDSVRRYLGATVITPMPSADCETRHCRSAMLDVGALSGPLATPNDIAVGGPDLLRVIIGRDDHAGDAALERGEAVVFTPALVHRGTAAVSVAGSNGGPVAVPATALPVGSRSAAAGAILPASLASRLRLTPVTEQYLVSTPSTPTQSDVDRAQAALARPGDAGIYADLTVERGYQPQRWGYGLLALALVAAIVTLGATGITTGLSAAESRPDLATLAAVGGSPLTRRLLVAHQAGTVALLGSLTGVVSGLVPAYGVLRSRADYPFTVPWETIGVVAVGVPLLAVVATALLTSTRGTISRRAA